MSNILTEDYESVINSGINWEDFNNSVVLITGATGLIGANIIKSFLYVDDKLKLNIKLVALVRDLDKAKRIFGEDRRINYIDTPIEFLKPDECQADYIIHGAAATASSFFVSNPVETMSIAFLGTQAVLELAKKSKAKGMIFLSTMEVYGNPGKGVMACETDVSGFLPENSRNSYPLSKLACENLCLSYFHEYKVPTVVIRLTQTFGPGVDYNDSRIFAEFMRCVIEKNNIVLRTKGETERAYLYTADAVSAILTVMTRGSLGECYTAANPDTYCSISQMAEMVAKNVAGGDIGVEYILGENNNLGYADTLYMQLDVSKLQKLGWTPKVGLEEMFKRMIGHFYE